MKSDSIIFDVDGTLWDSTGIIAEVWTDIIRKYTDLTITLTADYLKTLFGRTLPDIAAIIFHEYTPKEQLRLIHLCCEAEHAALLKHGALLYPRLEDTLKILSEKYRLFIVSNCQAGYIEVFLKATGFGKYFQGHLCPGDTGNAKAANIQQIKESFHLVAPVYVGDTDGDFQACRETGIPFVFASYGFGHVDSPDYRISCPYDLTRIFN